MSDAPKRRLFFVLLLVLIGGFMFVSPVFSARKMPEFKLPSALGGDKISSENYRGKVLLVNFWATWCPPCRKEIPSFKEFQAQYGAKGFSVIGISLDEGGARFKTVRKLINKLQINYPIAMGSTKTGRDFGGIGGIPVTFVVDRQGNIVKRFDGYIEKKTIQKELENLLR